MRISRRIVPGLACIAMIAAGQAPASQAPAPAVGGYGATIAAASGTQALPGAAPTPAVVDMDAVVVTGVQQGPGLWQVRKGGNTLWILGTVAPLPKDLEWASPQAESVLARAQEVIGRPGYGASISAGGMFKLAFGMPTVLKARRNPGDRTLAQVLPEGLYSRWAALKAEYMPHNRAVEGWRPTFAAGELYGEALKRRGLDGGDVGAQVDAMVKRRKTRVTTTRVDARITDPKGMARSLSRTELDEVQCFRSVLDRLDVDVASAVERANAWALGDVATLRRLAKRSSLRPCFEAFASTDAARELGLDDAIARSESRWLAAAETALARNTDTFALLDVEQLFRDDGLLARLQARGYEVVAPE